MKYLLFIFSFLIHSLCFAQDEETDSSAVRRSSNSKGIQSGLYIGFLFPNKSTASLYDGYGYDIYSVKNDFLNSFMYQKIVVEYGGGNGQTDQIAQSLNVNPGEWAFDKTDMPINMRYSPTLTVGLQGRWKASKQTSVILNVNAAKLSANGNFTIQLLTPPIGPVQPGYQNFKIFSIIGVEQRLWFQAGLQRIFGKDEVIGFLLEGGLALNMVKFYRNEIIINNLRIDLMTFYNQYGNEIYRAKNLTGVSFGAFGSVGANINTASNWTVQFLYTPMYGKVNLIQNQELALQHTLGLRLYYDF